MIVGRVWHGGATCFESEASWEGRVGSRTSFPASVEVCISGAVSQRHG